jgi:N-sulfoglucosamine sulfohydrolase
LIALVVVACGEAELELEVEDAVAREAGGALDPQPNIILVMAEDLGLRIGAYGDTVAATPNLDRFAREGTRYTRAFTTAGVCSPSRAAIITGVHQNIWGAGHMRSAGGGYAASPPPPIKAFPELLRAAGYYTINDGKTDYQMGTRLGGAYGGPETPWDDGDSNDWSSRAPGQPFIAYVNLFQTHESQVWPTWMLPDSLLTLVLWPMRIWNHRQWPLRTDPARVVVPPYYPDTPTVRGDLARHYNNIATMDAAFGALLDRIEAAGIARDTIVIFTADHGDGLPRAKRSLYDSGLHVPMIVRWPGVADAGGESGRLVSAVDLAPTILAMADVPVPDWLQGRVFIGPDEAEPRPFVYAAGDRIDDEPDTVRALRDARFKYIRHYQPQRSYVPGSAFASAMPMMRELRARHAGGTLVGVPALWFREPRAPEELFDTANDPHEVVNLIAEPRQEARVARMRASLDTWLASHRDLGFLPEDQLRERFFPGGKSPVTAPPLLETTGAVLRISSPSEGASIESRINGGAWRLYTGPTALEPGDAIEARAQRHGWKMSRQVETIAAAER